MGGSSGGSSGEVDYPDYMKTQHEAWLTAVAADITTAQATSPYTGVSAYDPDDNLDEMELGVDALEGYVNSLLNESGLTLSDLSTAMNAYLTMVALIDSGSEISTLFSDLYSSISSTISSDDAIEDDVGAYDDIITTEVKTKTLPLFEAGMRDINAVNSTSFVIGEALIWAEKDRAVAKYAGELKARRSELAITSTVQMSELFFRVLESKRTFAQVFLDHYYKSVNLFSDYTKTRIEKNRIAIVAKKEEADENLRIDVADAKWDLELYQFGSNVLAGISGGTVSASQADKPSSLQSALGGALSGAAMGAQVSGGNPLGAGIGALLGGAIGFLS